MKISVEFSVLGPNESEMKLFIKRKKKESEMKLLDFASTLTKWKRNGGKFNLFS